MGLGLAATQLLGDVNEPRRPDALSASGAILAAQVCGGLRDWTSEHLAIGADLR